MKLAARFDAVIAYFSQANPDTSSELVYENPYQLLVSVMLSAQCTDKRVNMVTPRFFERFPTPYELAEAKFEEVFALISSISYPNAKSRHLIEAAGILVSRFGGEVPSDIDDLMSLPGVGRKTANVVASIIYDKPVIAVDTHVFRVSHRLGLSEGKTPREVELDLERHIPAELRAVAHHWLILHGRYVCKALKPACNECGLKETCKFYQSQN